MYLERREDDLHEVSLEGVGVVVGVSYISLPIHTEVMQFVLEREKTTYMRFRRKVSGLLRSRELHLAPYTYRSHAVCIREREDDLHEV